jgi:cytochrome c biogenesis protein CcmG/thiol:disulfide interchange protein DsbE
MATVISPDVAPARPSRINKRVLLVGAAIVLPLIGILVANLGRDPHMVRSPLVGRPAPDFALPPVGGGKPVTLESLRGKPVVINFWATWCVPCFEEHPALAAAARGLPDVQFLGVIYEDEETRTQAFLKERGSAYPSLMDPDGRAAIAFGVFGVPETFFIDAEGRIVEKYVGPLQRSTIAELVARARGGKR